MTDISSRHKPEMLFQDVAVDSAEYWHGRAIAARGVGEKLKTTEAKSMMLAIADDYDLFSERARIREERGRGF